jgi:hypothetical protein
LFQLCFECVFLFFSFINYRHMPSEGRCSMKPPLVRLESKAYHIVCYCRFRDCKFKSHWCGGRVLLDKNDNELHFSGWLEPLVDRIAADLSTVVCPVIEIVGDNDFQFHSTRSQDVQIGKFRLANLVFGWMVPNREDRYEGRISSLR